jgi:Protein of unknown function (DUF3800)
VATVYLFGDEAGNFDFSHGSGASRYFILATVTMSDCQAGDRIQALRRRLAWRGVHLGAVLHATEDPQAVRDEVFGTLQRCEIRVDATIIAKTLIPVEMRDGHRLYRYAWHEHFGRIASEVAGAGDRLLAVASDLGTRKRRGAFHLAVDDAVRASAHCPHRVAFWPNMSEPCLVVADYCTWAIQRRWERNDRRSHELITHQIASEVRVPSLPNVPESK